ncbi:MAG: hypothetical protein WKF47_15815 [Geodermatophilaceae bacterium]
MFQTRVRLLVGHHRGEHLLTIRAAALDHRRFSDAMHVLDAAALAQIEHASRSG